MELGDGLRVGEVAAEGVSVACQELMLASLEEDVVGCEINDYAPCVEKDHPGSGDPVRVSEPQLQPHVLPVRDDGERVVGRERLPVGRGRCGVPVLEVREDGPHRIPLGVVERLDLEGTTFVEHDREPAELHVHGAKSPSSTTVTSVVGGTAGAGAAKTRGRRTEPSTSLRMSLLCI